MVLSALSNWEENLFFVFPYFGFELWQLAELEKQGTDDPTVVQYGSRGKGEAKGQPSIARTGQKSANSKGQCSPAKLTIFVQVRVLGGFVI